MNPLKITSIIYGICLGLLLILLGTQEVVFFQRKAIIQTPDAYLVIHEESVSRSKLREEDWFVADQRIYVLLDEASQVNVYDTSGRFLYGILTEHIRNGKAEIGMQNGQLIVKTRSNHFLVFEGETMVRYVPTVTDRDDPGYEEYDRIRSDLRSFQQQKKGYDEISRTGNRLYRLNNAQKPECIVRIPISLRKPIILSVFVLTAIYILIRFLFIRKAEIQR